MGTVVQPVSHAARRAANRVAPIRIGAGALLAGVSFLTIRALPVHHDIAWPLHVAAEVISGAAPYVDIIEVHPPLILWFSLASQHVAGWSSISAIAAYHTLTLLTGLLSLVTAAAAIQLAVRDSFNGTLLFVATAAVLFPFVGYSFGQEEHLMLCLTMPYLLLAAARLRGGHPTAALALMVGLMAGVGLAMKPLYGVGWLAVEAAIALSAGWRRLLRPESIIAATMLLLYPVAVLLVAPDYLQVARWAGQVYYAFHPTPFVQIILSAATACVAAALVLHLAADDHEAPVRRVVVAFLLGCTVVVLAQGKGWSYHWYPALASALLLMCVAAPGVVVRISSRPTLGRPAAILASVAVVLAGLVELQRDARTYATLEGDPYYLPTMQALVQQHAPGGSIMALSTTMQIGFPLVNYTGATWASRFATLWLLPGLYSDIGSGRPYPYRPTEARSQLESYLFEAVIEDMSTGRPDLLIVDRYSPSAATAGFRYLEYFGRDPRFRRMLENYELVADVDRFMVFARSSTAGGP